MKVIKQLMLWFCNFVVCLFCFFRTRFFLLCLYYILPVWMLVPLLLENENFIWLFLLELPMNATSRYLHEVCSPSVVHKNFKSANILLDMELNPHISDCGLASLIPDAEYQVKASIIYFHSDSHNFRMEITIYFIS